MQSVCVLSPGHPLSPPELSCTSHHPGCGISATVPHAHTQCSLETVPARNTVPPLTENKTKVTNQVISTCLHCKPSGKIASTKIYHASRAFKIRGCSRSLEKSSREHDMGKRGNHTENNAELLMAAPSTTAGVVQPSFETQGWKPLLKHEQKLLWEQIRKATGCHAMPGKNGLNKNSKLGATSWPNITLLSTQPTLGNRALISLPCCSRIYDIKEKQ